MLTTHETVFWRYFIADTSVCTLLSNAVHNNCNLLQLQPRSIYLEIPTSWAHATTAQAQETTAQPQASTAQAQEISTQSQATTVQAQETTAQPQEATTNILKISTLRQVTTVAMTTRIPYKFGHTGPTAGTKMTQSCNDMLGMEPVSVDTAAKHHALLEYVYEQGELTSTWFSIFQAIN